MAIRDFVVSPEVYEMVLRKVCDDLYKSDEYYIFQHKYNGTVYFRKKGNGVGGFVEASREEIPDEILDEIAKDLI